MKCQRCGVENDEYICEPCNDSIYDEWIDDAEHYCDSCEGGDCMACEYGDIDDDCDYEKCRSCKQWFYPEELEDGLCADCSNPTSCGCYPCDSCTHRRIYEVSNSKQRCTVPCGTLERLQLQKG